MAIVKKLLSRLLGQLIFTLLQNGLPCLVSLWIKDQFNKTIRDFEQAIYYFDKAANLSECVIKCFKLAIRHSDVAINQSECTIKCLEEAFNQSEEAIKYNLLLFSVLRVFFLRCLNEEGNVFMQFNPENNFQEELLTWLIHLCVL